MKVVNLKLPNGQERDYSDFNEYEKDYNQCIEQMTWKINNNKSLEEDTRRLKLSELSLNSKILFSNQRSKFKADDVVAWQESMDRLKNIMKRESESNKAISATLNQLYEQYDSSNEKERQRGRLNFRIAVIEAFGEEHGFMEDWDNKMFHGGMEIGDVLRKLYFSNKLNDVVSKFT